MEISGLTEGVANMAGDLTSSLNPANLNLGAQLGGQLSVQDRAFLDAFNRQEQQELHEVPKFTAYIIKKPAFIDGIWVSVPRLTSMERPTV